MSRLWPLAALLLLLSWLAGAPPTVYSQNTDVVLQFAPNSLQVAVGETVDVAVEVENVTGLYGFDIAVGFDPAVVEVVDLDPNLPGNQMALGLFLDPGFVIFNQADNDLGQLRLVMTQLNPSEAKSGRGNLLIIRFRGLQAGQTPLLLLAGQLAQRDGTTFLPERVDGELAVIATAVPLPTPSPIPSQLAGTPMPTMTPTATPTPRATGAATATPQPPTLTPAASPTAVITAPATAPAVVTLPAAAPTLTATSVAGAAALVEEPTAGATAVPTEMAPLADPPVTDIAGTAPTAVAAAGTGAAEEAALPATVVGSGQPAGDAASGNGPGGTAVADEASGWRPMTALGAGLLLVILSLVFFLGRKQRLER